MREKLEIIVTVAFILSAALLGRQWAVIVEGSGELSGNRLFSVDKSKKETVEGTETEAKEDKKEVIVVDAGHGGDDPGKIGINGAEEKDLNLQIALKLKAALEKEGYTIYLTREDEDGLYSRSDRNKKAADMQKRCELIEKVSPVFTISIHQNSYTEEYVKGAQVFYYDQSADGKALAEKLQESLVQKLDKENHRKAKGNTSYYLLKKTSAPTVIVECGFLSNREEAELLGTEAYQDKIVDAVCEGIGSYLVTVYRCITCEQ